MTNLASELEHKKIRKILVIKLKYHGDVLLTSPVFNVLKDTYPNAEIDAVIYDITAPMLELHPCIHKIYKLKKKSQIGLKNYIQQEIDFMKEIRHHYYDIVIHLDESIRGLIIAKMSNAPITVATSTKDRNQWLWKKSFTRIFEHLGHNKRHMVEIHLDSLRMLGLSPKEELKSMTFETSDDTKSKIQTILSSNFLNSKDYIVLHPTSRCLFKSLTPEQNVKLIYKLNDKYKLPIVLTAGPDSKEMAFIAEFIRLLEQSNYQGKIINLAGTLSLKELGEFIRQAKLFVGADSMPMHVASAVQTPTIVFFGPSLDVQWSPWKNKHQLITPQNYSCRPCSLDGCGNSEISDCLIHLDIDSIELMDL